ncbi:MAG: hypothetical protein LBC31_02735 [Treponema sp.]|jgi:hypothetical protein|nr:hypothetical protein [Treponema sp.]
MRRNLTTDPRRRGPGGRAWSIAEPLLGKLIKYTVWVIGLAALGLAACYAAGSYRKTGGGAQLLLVRFSLVLSLLLIISSFYGLVLDVIYAVKRKRAAYLLGVLGYASLMALGALLLLGASFIIGAVGGNR